MKTEEDDLTICFSCICSFKNTEPNFLNIQEPHDVKETYRPLMGDKEASDLALNPLIADWRLITSAVEPAITPFFPGLLTIVLPMPQLHENNSPSTARTYISSPR